MGQTEFDKIAPYVRESSGFSVGFTGKYKAWSQQTVDTVVETVDENGDYRQTPRRDTYRYESRGSVGVPVYRHGVETVPGTPPSRISFPGNR